MNDQHAQPALFVSHGSPMLVLDESPARTFLERFACDLPRPKAIVVASAHYEAPGPSLSGGQAPRTIHDFGGFPAALYGVQYPAPGAPQIARRAAALLAASGFSPLIDPDRGLDHGVWTPLKLIYREADIPIVAMSVDPTRTPQWHYDVGVALRPLRAEGVMIIGSGSATHNLGEYFAPRAASTPDWVEAFDQWLWRALEERRLDDLLFYRDRAPFGARNHPSEEHILPLFTALGAGDTRAPTRLHHSYDRVLAMDAFGFAPIERDARAG